MDEKALPAILIVENNTTHQMVMQVLCEKFGFVPYFVSSVEEALAAVRGGRNCYLAILMDWQLTGMSGIECTRIIRQLEAKTNKHIPIIAVTAHALKGDREKCMAAGMDDYLSKPFTADELHNVILRWTHNGAELDAQPPPGS